MSRPKPPTYRTTNWHDYNAALARRGSLSIWFDPEMQWQAAPTGKPGRQPVFTDAAIQACLTLKALFGLPLRQTTGMVAGLPDRTGSLTTGMTCRVSQHRTFPGTSSFATSRPRGNRKPLFAGPPRAPGKRLLPNGEMDCGREPPYSRILI